MDLTKYLLIAILIAIIIIYFLYTKNTKNEQMVNKSLYIITKLIEEKGVKSDVVEVKKTVAELEPVIEDNTKDTTKLNSVDKEDIYRQYGVKL